MHDTAVKIMPPLTRRQSGRHADRSPEADPSKHALRDAKKTPSLLALPLELQETILKYVRKAHLLFIRRSSLTGGLSVASSLGSKKALSCIERTARSRAATSLSRCCNTGECAESSSCFHIHLGPPRLATH
jgi:hypothetical protein